MSNVLLNICRSSSGGNVLPEHAEAAKNEGNRAFFDMDDNTAIWHYTQVGQPPARLGLLSDGIAPSRPHSPA